MLVLIHPTPDSFLLRLSAGLTRMDGDAPDSLLVLPFLSYRKRTLWLCQKVSIVIMAELTRTIVSRLRQFVGDRRHSKRQKVRLAFSLSLSSKTKSLNGTKKINSMEGHTLDVSSNGLALIVPRITLGEHHLIGENRSLNIRLQLPDGPVELQATPVRYERLEDSRNEMGYLIAARIVGMPGADRSRFSEYVAALRKGNS